MNHCVVEDSEESVWNKYYHVIPKNDGYHYVCLNKHNEKYELWHKCEDTIPEYLVPIEFNTFEEGTVFLDSNNMNNEYMLEPFWRRAYGG